MSAPALPHRPSPADLARRQPSPRPAPVTPASPPAAAARQAPADDAADKVGANGLREGELMRVMYLRAMRSSRMLPESRLVALTLMGYADHRTGALSRYAPDPAQLSYATGLSVRQALLHVEILTQRGWLGTHKPSQGPRMGQDVLNLAIPPWLLKQIRDRPTGATA